MLCALIATTGKFDTPQLHLLQLLCNKVTLYLVMMFFQTMINEHKQQPGTSVLQIAMQKRKGNLYSPSDLLQPRNTISPKHKKLVEVVKSNTACNSFHQVATHDFQIIPLTFSPHLTLAAIKLQRSTTTKFWCIEINLSQVIS